MKHTFPKKEHLYGTTSTQALYQKGKAFLCYPVRVVYRKVEKEEVPIRLLVHAPKKRFKRAVHRNRYKRLLRECYRLNNEALKVTMQDKEYSLHLSITAVSNHIPTYADLEPKVIAALDELIQRLNS